MSCFLDTDTKENCFGCEACAQICPHGAIEMVCDFEGFRYPEVNENKCIRCNMCKNVCPYENMPKSFDEGKKVYGGYIKDAKIRDKSTSGGAFSAIALEYCDENYVIFGAEAKGLSVFHSYITDKRNLERFRKSKYSQSVIGTAYVECRRFLKEEKKVLFTGTPCQIAGLKAYLGDKEYDNLLTVEVICEGVPSPLYMRKYEEYLFEKYGARIISLDYRYTDSNSVNNPTSGKWDFEVMSTLLENGEKIKKDRWFNPFWSIWLGHLMSRPSCYKCPFTTTSRVADISLGDLWGVHLYCPELYGKNMGTSLVVCNTEKGKKLFEKAKGSMYGHALDFDTALKYQSPMRKAIDMNVDRDKCMADLINPDCSYEYINRKWAKKPTFRLLWQKYVWGNRQKIALWNVMHKKRKGKDND